MINMLLSYMETVDSETVFKLSTRKRNNEKEQWFFVFPVTKFTIVLRTQQVTTGCEFNQVVPLNKVSWL